MKVKEKTLCYSILAANRYAHCPEGVNKRRFSAIRTVMERSFMKAWMDTPVGLYTEAQIWEQTHRHWL